MTTEITARHRSCHSRRRRARRRRRGADRPALVAGGLPIIELTLRTPAALAAIERIADEVPEIIVGAGTIVEHHPAQTGPCRGRSISRLPGQHARTCGRPCATPDYRTCPAWPPCPKSWALLEDGYTDMKFFPAEAAAARRICVAIHSPVPAARFCPTGGITPTNMAEYLKTPNVGCVGGSWLTPPMPCKAMTGNVFPGLAAVAAALADPTMRRS